MMGSGCLFAFFQKFLPVNVTNTRQFLSAVTRLFSVLTTNCHVTTRIADQPVYAFWRITRVLTREPTGTISNDFRHPDFGDAAATQLCPPGSHRQPLQATYPSWATCGDGFQLCRAALQLCR